MSTALASIVVPTYDRPDRLARCVAGLSALRMDPATFEVLIVDDGGNADLQAVLQPYRSRLNLELVRQPHAGPAAARNAGASQASGNVLAFTDDDCVPDPDWLVELLRCHREEPAALIGGRTVNALAGNLFAEASQDLVSYLYDYYAAAGGPAFFTSNNMLMAREAFLELGGFDTSFPLAAGEDRELCDRWRVHGRPLRYHPPALVHHHHGLDLRRFWRQHRNYGRGAFRFHAIRQERGERRTLEPASFYLRLIGYPLRQGRPTSRALAGAALLALSQAANATGYFHERHAARVR